MAKYYSKSVLISILKKRENELGRIPQPEDMVDPDGKVFLNYFKRWDKALKAAGLNHKTYMGQEKKEPLKVKDVKEKAAVKENVKTKPEVKEGKKKNRYIVVIPNQLSVKCCWMSSIV